MNRTLLLASLVLATCFVPIATDSGEASAEDQGAVIYCYGNGPTLVYPYPITDGMTVAWDAVDSTGSQIECKPSTGSRTEVDLTGADMVHVTQTVSSGSTVKTETFTLVHLGIGDSTYTVRFMDGETILDTQTIDSSTVITAGNDFVVVPSDPGKKGQTFAGWHVGSPAGDPFDPKEPIMGSVDIYASWTSVSTGGTGTTVIGPYVVTFDVCPGMTYKVIEAGSKSVRFSVSPADGYDMDLSTLSVTADRITLLPSGNEYELGGISGDTVITIRCDMMEPASEPDEGSEDSFPWWILVIPVVAVIGLLLVRRMR